MSYFFKNLISNRKLNLGGHQKTNMTKIANRMKQGSMTKETNSLRFFYFPLLVPISL